MPKGQPRRSKYGASPVMVDGVRFASKAEARRYGELRLLLRDGQITCLRRQPRFVLQKKFVRNGVTVRAVTYTADFEYYEKGRHIVEDVKGHATEVFKVKWRWFLAKYPDVDARIVQAGGVTK